MELLELSFTLFWNEYPRQHIQEEMAAVALVSPPGWEAALCQVLPALFRRVPLRSDLATSCWKALCWLVWAIHEDDGLRVTLCGHTFCVLPCTCRQYAGKRQGKVAVQVGTTRIRKLSCCQDVIAPLS